MQGCSKWRETPLCREYYTEKCVMNNYFGIGLDAKISLDFNNKRDEHPEKCRWVPAPAHACPSGLVVVSPSGRGVISGVHRALRQSTDTEPEHLVRKWGTSVCRGHGSGISMSPSGGVRACSPAKPSSRQMPQERPRGGVSLGVFSFSPKSPRISPKSPRITTCLPLAGERTERNGKVSSWLK